MCGKNTICVNTNGDFNCNPKFNFFKFFEDVGIIIILFGFIVIVMIVTLVIGFILHGFYRIFYKNILSKSKQESPLNG